MSVLPVAFLGSGLVLLATSAVLVSRTRRLQRVGLRANALIVAVHISEDRSTEGGTTTSYTPEFRFTDHRNESHTIRALFGTGTASTFAVGQIVPVIYDPERPEKARLTVGGQMWMFPIIWGIVGFVFFAVGALMMLLLH